VQDISITLSRPAFESKRRELLQKGVNLPATGDRGEASAQGVVVAFTFEPGAGGGRFGVLTLRLVDKPLFFPDTLVESHIREWFAQ
jgi:hypothetical protein